MKDTYLEGAQQEVFAEAKISKKVKFVPSAQFYAKAKKAIETFFYTFAETDSDMQDELNVVNPTKFQKIAEEYALGAIDTAIEAYFDDERNFESMDEFVKECLALKVATKVTPDED